MKGLGLSESFYREVAAKILEADFPKLKYSAGLIGWGSEVLGFDDKLSTDHNWGLRFQLFLSADDFEEFYNEIDKAFAEKLPSKFKNYPTDFEINVHKDQRDPEKIKNAKHNIDIETVKGFFKRYLGCDPFREITVADWLTFPEHKLLAVTSGKVFYDGLGELRKARQKFKYYPKDIWLYLLANQWNKIFQEQAFIGRCGYAGDDLGSKLIAARLVENLMRLCFLLEQNYAPYSKWFGMAFAKLDCAAELIPVFDEVLNAADWQKREAFLGRAYEKIIRNFNALEITKPMSPEISEFFERPFLVIKDESVVENLREAISDEKVLKLPPRLGSVNQFTNSSDKLNDVAFTKRLKQLYE